MTIISYVWVVSMYLSSIYLSLPDEPCWKPQLQQRRRTAEAESGLQNPQILWDQFTSPSSKVFEECCSQHKQARLNALAIY